MAKFIPETEATQPDPQQLDARRLRWAPVPKMLEASADNFVASLLSIEHSANPSLG